MDKKIESTVRCKAFTGEGVRLNRVLVVDGTCVKVYDSIAGHYTACHAISPKTQKRIIDRARRAALRRRSLYGPTDIRNARTAAGLTQSQAAAMVHSTLRRWQDWEDDVSMPPALFNSFRLKLRALALE